MYLLGILQIHLVLIILGLLPQVKRLPKIQYHSSVTAAL